MSVIGIPYTQVKLTEEPNDIWFDVVALNSTPILVLIRVFLEYRESMTCLTI